MQILHTQCSRRYSIDPEAVVLSGDIWTEYRPFYKSLWRQGEGGQNLVRCIESSYYRGCVLSNLPKMLPETASMFCDVILLQNLPYFAGHYILLTKRKKRAAKLWACPNSNKGTKNESSLAKISNQLASMAARVLLKRASISKAFSTIRNASFAVNRSK